MNHETEPVNTIAPLTNVALCVSALELAINRPSHLPGMVSFYGPSGYGKSFAAAFAANKLDAYHVECKSAWTKKAFLSNVLKEMGIHSAKTIPEMIDQVAEQLALSERPLIIDEFDHIVHKKVVEVVRDIYEGSNAAILLIGEEQLDTNLKHWERFHNRILKWEPAQPASLEDIHLLRSLYCTQVEVGDDILKTILTINKGCTRRICVNLYNVYQFALTNGLSSVSMQEWGKRPFCTGNAPRRRKA